MREIKFRAWDKNIKKFIAPTDLKIRGDNVIYYCEGRDNMLIVMQYTGLKDCNGREIYEGDIVRLVGDLKMLYDNFDYYSTISEVVFDDNEICFNAPRIAPPLNKNNCIYFEIIGNIYENGDLLI